MTMQPHMTTIWHQAHEGFGAAVNNALVSVGERFGLYSVLADIGPASADHVAEHTGIPVRQVAHWLRDQAEAGYLVHDEATGCFSSWCDISRS